MANLYVMVGCPGSGKSTFAKKLLEEISSPEAALTAPIEVVSRDEIRFSLLPKDFLPKEYFSKEKEVEKVFYQRINDGLARGSHVIADATHLNIYSRNKLLKRVSGYDDKYAYFMTTPLDICLERNETRKDTPTYVPRDVVERMYYQATAPDVDEDFKFCVWV